jgi:hypothetical protein
MAVDQTEQDQALNLIGNPICSTILRSKFEDRWAIAQFLAKAISAIPWRKTQGIRLFLLRKIYSHFRGNAYREYRNDFYDTLTEQNDVDAVFEAREKMDDIIFSIQRRRVMLELEIRGDKAWAA